MLLMTAAVNNEYLSEIEIKYIFRNQIIIFFCQYQTVYT